VSESPNVGHNVSSQAISWMIEVASEFSLQPSTLFLACSYFNRFLMSTRTLPPWGLLQLVALACLSTASKQEEVEQRSPLCWLNLARGRDGGILFTVCGLLGLLSKLAVGE
jgi:hypothetical protein